MEVTTAATDPATSADAIGASADVAVGAPRGLYRIGWRRLRRDLAGMIGLTIFVAFVLMALIGPMVTPYNPTVGEFDHINEGISWSHLLGTDDLGRDVLSRILAGTRTGLFVATLATTLSISIGLVLGSIAGYRGGFVDTVISRAIDFMSAFPTILLAMFVGATLGPLISRELTGKADPDPTIQYLVVVSSLSLVLWAGSARLIRGQILSLREREFIMAAQAEGAKPRWIIRKHLIPNAAGPLIVAASLNFGGALLLEAALSYLGIGIRAPRTSLGAMISEYLTQWRYHPRLVLAPALVLAIVMVGMSLLGDATNDALDPRRRR
jgi:ABC-type dipeptide/oligopeptide/nickel transport system permease subunit